MNSIGSVIGFRVPMCQVNKIGFQHLYKNMVQYYDEHVITLLEEL